MFLRGDAAAPSAGAPALSARALSLRTRAGVPLLDNDYPLDPDAVATLRAAGLRVRERSRWLRAVSGWAAPADLDRIRALPGVARVAPVGRLAPPEPVGRAEPEADARVLMPPDSFYGRSAAQVAQIGVPLAHDLGFTGSGVRIAILDTGFRLDHVATQDVTVVATHDFIQGDDVVSNQPGDDPSQDDHGTETWSVLGAHAPGELVGPAYGAEFVLAKVEDVPTETSADEDRWVAGLEWADSLGAQVVSSSLGYRSFDGGFTYPIGALDGDSTVTTRAADEAARRGILVVNAVGNGGPGLRTLNAPADADSIISVGAVDANGVVADFSARGPTGDGRTKPELVARGVQTSAASPFVTTGYVRVDGTSFSTPLVAGGAALFIEAWPGLGGIAAREALILSGSLRQPNDSLGHGLPDVASAILFPQGIAPIASGGTAPGGTLGSLAPTFSWNVSLLHPAARPVRYVVQVAADTGFTRILARDTVVDAQVLDLAHPLPASSGLWWRVVAETAPGVTRASPAVGPITMPNWVSLLTLNDPNGVFITDATPRLQWRPLPAPPPVGPLTYDVEIIAASGGRVVAAFPALADTVVTVTEPLPFNEPFRWRVIARSANGAVDTTTNAANFVVVSSSAPPVTLLYQNFPNPFPRAGEPSTSIWFDLARRSVVRLRVFDLHGRLVRRLIPNGRLGCSPLTLDAGSYGRGDSGDACLTTTWDGRDDDGDRLPAGVYIIRLEADGVERTVRTLYRP